MALSVLKYSLQTSKPGLFLSTDLVTCLIMNLKLSVVVFLSPMQEVGPLGGLIYQPISGETLLCASPPR